jgi:pimeloyl-ACP methyl ester carboxylesterase
MGENLAPASSSLRLAPWRLLAALTIAALAACSSDPGSGGADGSGDSADGSGDTGLDAEPDGSGEPDTLPEDTTEADTTPPDTSGDGSGDTVDESLDTEPPDTGSPDTKPPGCPPGLRPVAFGEDLTLGMLDAVRELPRCAAAAFTAVIPSGTRWRIRFIGLPADARLFAYTPHYFATVGTTESREPIASSGFVGAGGEGWLDVSPPFSGEVVIVVERDLLEDAVTARVTTSCSSGCDRRTTRFPTLLVHGYFGTDTYFGLLDYFHDVPDRLREAGYDVRTPITDAFNWSEVRGEQLAAQVDEVLRETGARKVNLIGHSQGGLDSRVLISGLGYADRVASLTTVATPHHGTPLLIQEIASVQDFSPDYMEGTFNPAYPDAPGVTYWSWSGRTCGLLDFACQSANDGETADPILLAFFISLSRFGANDGFVPTSSAAWGTDLGTLSADHMDQVGQIADGISSNDPFDHRAFYRSELDRLAAAGF